MSTKLAEYGMNKPKADRFPTHPQLQLSRDFWRGVVDADGTIYKQYDQGAFSLYGHLPMLELFKNWLNSLNINTLNITKKENGSVLIPAQKPLYQIGTAGTIAKRILSALYANASTYLDRKMERAQSIISAGK